MNAKLKTFGALLLASLVATPSFATADFDNADIPIGANARFVGGCGTITKFEPVTNLRPQYTDRQPGQGHIGGSAGGEFSQILSMIPGVGAVAAIVGGAAAAIVTNATINSINKETDEKAAQEQTWEKVYLIGIQPDFGAEYTIVYEKLNQRDPSVGTRVRVSSDAFSPSAPSKFNLNLSGGDSGEVGSDKYFDTCYASYLNGKSADLTYRQLVRTGNGFEWKKLDPKLQPAATTYLTKQSAERAAKEAERAEIDAAKKNESR